MGLQFLVESLDVVDAEFQSLYAKTEDGKFQLSVEGIDTGEELKKALDKEREAAKTESKARKELEQRMKAFDGIDIEKAKKAQEQLSKLEDKKLLDDGNIEELLLKRTENMRADHQSQVAKLMEVQANIIKERDTYKNHLSNSVVQQAIIDAVMKVGSPRSQAMPDIIFRGKQDWSLSEEGDPVCRSTDGSTVYGKDGKAPITPIEWAQNLIEKAPHLWNESKGGGSTGSRTGDSKYTAAQLASMSPAEKMKLGRKL